ncbi:PLP-dependent aminotransferase family protein [Chryseobacterium sp. Ch-15]|uniref:PLP-dependent aminotransferase family protein n=1 Tax=Chryseobacterium muglaense TaxID=2893752 RepID=A0A9Q3UUP6_9FLAO|nr:PLP-dependent aminotransferase family protein [Chryseobacterium muglaense]MBD3907027.1 PLP-dependent aminotransferase family protein [Chryseobacterium muglaense]MCC9034121.1 PLP-dependent aminotransferase family protein [Chryseobacterium muglaense]MCM2556742.1 PLP-dependent aminotransferase family protein [Chryseobacterium muglaense]
MKNFKYQIFTSVIEEHIKNGALIPGDRLPSVREIKEKYQLSITSVQSGYDYLVMKGWVENRPRSGFYVSIKTNEKIPENALKFLPIVRNLDFDKKVKLTSKSGKSFEQISFSTTAPNDLLIPQKLILRKMQEVIRKKGASILRYYPANGSEVLRDQIASRSTKLGCKINLEQLIITDGALQALYIALASVTQSGDVVAVESPCVFSVLEVISNLKLKIIEIPVHYKNGFDVNYLKEILLENNIRAIALTSNFHNPTGILMSDEAKKELALIAQSNEIPIIENDIYGDLYFDGERPATICKFDTEGWVMTYSSFSKTLAPGIRLGWLNSGRFFEQAERIKFSLGRSVAPIFQELMIELLEENSYDRHLRFFRKQLEIQCVELLNALRLYFPKECYFHRPQGGYSIWGKLPEKINMSEFYQFCESQKIAFTPGDTFTFTNAYSHHFRIIFADRITSESMLRLKIIGEKVQSILDENL